LGEVLSQIEDVSKEVEMKISNSAVKMSEVESATVWKIEECQKLLESRVNKQYITISIEAAEKRL